MKHMYDTHVTYNVPYRSINKISQANLIDVIPLDDILNRRKGSVLC